MTHRPAANRSNALNECIDHCNQCLSTCRETRDYCVKMGGSHATSEHISLLAVCADICATTANMVLRGAPILTVVSDACAEVCRECAIACDAFDDQESARCAEMCRRCAKSCVAIATEERLKSAGDGSFPPFTAIY